MALWKSRNADPKPTRIMMAGKLSDEFHQIRRLREIPSRDRAARRWIPPQREDVRNTDHCKVSQYSSDFPPSVADAGQMRNGPSVAQLLYQIEREIPSPTARPVGDADEVWA